MSASLLAVVVDCHDPYRLADFWATVLAYEVAVRNPGEVLASDPKGAGTPLCFMTAPEAKVVKNRLHLDVLADGPMGAEVSRLVAAGARVVELRQDRASVDHPHTSTVMQDPEGNEFCVLGSTTVDTVTSR